MNRCPHHDRKVLTLPGVWPRVRWCRDCGATMMETGRAGQRPTWCSPRAHRADPARALLKQVEHVAPRGMQVMRECPFCGAYEGEPHRTDCKAFTPAGALR
jgi:hypothetical protein